MLHPQQRRILEVIYRFRQQHGFAPSVREISKATGRNSTSVVNYHLNQLMQRGLLLKVPTTSRSVSLTILAYQLLGYPYDEQEAAPVQHQLERLAAENQQLQQDLHEARACQNQLQTLRAENKRLQQQLQHQRQLEEEQEELYNQLEAVISENKRLRQTQRVQPESQEGTMALYSQLVALQLAYDQLQLDHQNELAALARKFRLRYRRLVRFVKHKQFSSP